MKRVFRGLIGLFLSCSIFNFVFGQSPLVTYAGNSGKEVFYDVVQISDGTILVTGAADDLDWIPGSTPKIEMPNPGLNNAQGSNRYAFILQLSEDFSTILSVVHFPQGAAENIRYIKLTNVPGEPTGTIYISGNTEDTRSNDGGYFIAPLNDNFVDGLPSACSWAFSVWAEGYISDRQPWDVSHDGKVTYARGQSHAYDWASVHRLDAQGEREVVPMWRTHWIPGGGEFRDIAANYPNGGADSLGYSGIVLKEWGRCDLRSWDQNDYDLMQPDENGGMKKGKWPLDAFYKEFCDGNNVNTDGPGYSGYSMGATPVHGAMSIAVDRRTGHTFMGMNVKTVTPANFPDFEPAVIAFDADGGLMWWSRLYHEITPAGDTMVSEPDQYVDALAIDYSQPASDAFLVVDARCHGNNVENLWEGNVIAGNPAANGFQNRFTGTSGNIHISWLGKLKLSDGQLMHSTYVAEYAEGASSFGNAHPDPNLDGWPSPNGGWPDVNTTRLAPNNMKVTMNGSVCVIGTGRRTITTRNAYQKMVLPGNGGLSSWNNFVRVYDAELNHPVYSSLVVGQWDTLTQQGGGNTDLFGVFKMENGVVAVGRQDEDPNNPGQAKGNDIPTVNVPQWGSAVPAGESAILVYYPADSLENPLDSPVQVAQSRSDENRLKFGLYPNPGAGEVHVSLEQSTPAELVLLDLTGRVVFRKELADRTDYLLELGELDRGIYLVELRQAGSRATQKLILQ